MVSTMRSKAVCSSLERLRNGEEVEGEDRIWDWEMLLPRIERASEIVQSQSSQVGP
jgi:hypothetical protein